MHAILTTYDQELGTYYDHYTEELQALFRSDITPDKFHAAGRQLKRMAGRLGAHIAKAGQRATRTLLIERLLAAKADGADLTFNNAQAMARATIGREINAQLAHKHFSTAHRTGRLADRSTLTEDAQHALVAALKPEIDELTRKLAAIREQRAATWRASPQRERVYALLAQIKATPQRDDQNA